MDSDDCMQSVQLCEATVCENCVVCSCFVGDTFDIDSNVSTLLDKP